jgi:ubiquitin thioesterase protein OTUB1
VFEDFYDVFVRLVRHIVVPSDRGEVLTPATLLQAFQDPESALYFLIIILYRVRFNTKDYSK